MEGVLIILLLDSRANHIFENIDSFNNCTLDIW